MGTSNWPLTVAKPDIVYQCPSCEARFLGEQRCEECNTWARRLGPGGLCPCCDEPISIMDLLHPDQFVARLRQQSSEGGDHESDLKEGRRDPIHRY